MPGASSSTSPRHGIGECSAGQPTAVVEGKPAKGPFTTADDGARTAPYLAPRPLSAQERKARIGRLGPEAAPRGPCGRCGDMTFGRPGESGRCPRCEIR